MGGAAPVLVWALGWRRVTCQGRLQCQELLQCQDTAMEATCLTMEDSGASGRGNRGRGKVHGQDNHKDKEPGLDTVRDIRPPRLQSQDSLRV